MPSTLGDNSFIPWYSQRIRCLKIPSSRHIRTRILEAKQIAVEDVACTLESTGTKLGIKMFKPMVDGNPLMWGKPDLFPGPERISKNRSGTC